MAWPDEEQITSFALSHTAVHGDFVLPQPDLYPDGELVMRQGKLVRAWSAEWATIGFVERGDVTENTIYLLKSGPGLCTN